VAVKAGSSSSAAAPGLIVALPFLDGLGEPQAVGVGRAAVDCAGVFIAVPPALGPAAGAELADGLLLAPLVPPAPDVGELLTVGVGVAVAVGVGVGVAVAVGLTVWVGELDAGGEADEVMTGTGVGRGVPEQAGE
jgi:hypothetical protein